MGISAHPRAGVYPWGGRKIIFQRFLHQLKPGLNFTPNFWRAAALSGLDPHGFALGAIPQGCSRPAQGCQHVTAGVRGAGFLSSVTQAVSAADSLQPRTRAVVWSRLAARPHSAAFHRERSHPAQCGQGALAAKGCCSRICSQKAKPAEILCWRKGEEELFCS